MANLHTSLSELFTNIANAIRNKTGSTDAIIADEFPNKIESINIGISLPEIADDVLGSASDLASGKQLIDDNGNIVTGTLKNESMLYAFATSINDNDSSEFELVGTTSNVTPSIVKNATPIKTGILKLKFGNATVEDVAAGVTFTSENGVKLTGTVTTKESGNNLYVDSNFGTITKTEGDLGLMYEFETPTLFKAGSIVTVEKPLSWFGTATAEDVTSGKTFTSAAGKQVVGTKVVPAIHTGSATPDASLGNDGDIYFVI